MIVVRLRRAWRGAQLFDLLGHSIKQVGRPTAKWLQSPLPWSASGNRNDTCNAQGSRSCSPAATLSWERLAGGSQAIGRSHTGRRHRRTPRCVASARCPYRQSVSSGPFSTFPALAPPEVPQQAGAKSTAVRASVREPLSASSAAHPPAECPARTMFFAGIPCLTHSPIFAMNWSAR